jgi:para-nitrobenzyl esterase
MDKHSDKSNNCMRHLALFFSLFIIFIADIAIAQQPSPVKVEEGLLQGTKEDGVAVYLGIPYAAPPVGELRWRAPQPPAHWKGVRKADKFSANPMQIMVKELGPWTPEYQPQGVISEDCLYLNIWTAAKSPKEKRPVVIYIPGGAFTGGSGNCPVYNGENLAKKGLVVVTINYRVGVIGFLALPELTKESKHNSSGNYGLLDQVAALKWVHKNISAFGGDPNQITIMGQSAGASSVNYLTASPLVKGLFIRAIAESGTGDEVGPRDSLESMEKLGMKFTEAIGARTLAELRAMPAAKLIDISTKEEFHFLPIVDGWFLPKSADEIFKEGKQNDVATITGWVADEGSFNNNYGKIPEAEFRKQVRQQAGAQADEILKLYPASTQEEAVISQKELARDISVVSMYLWGLKREETCKTKLYTYLFTHPQPGTTRERYQVFHSSELPYVFDNLNQSLRPWTAEDNNIEQTMTRYWINFISTGNPNGKGLPEWLSFRKSPPETMELGDKMEPIPITTMEKFEVLKKLLQESENKN